MLEIKFKKFLRCSSDNVTCDMLAAPHAAAASRLSQGLRPTDQASLQSAWIQDRRTVKGR